MVAEKFEEQIKHITTETIIAIFAAMSVKQYLGNFLNFYILIIKKNSSLYYNDNIYFLL